MPRPKSVAYWMKVSGEDWKTAKALIASKRYAHALLFGHQALEKLLKGLYAARKSKTPPFTHDLVRLARESGLDLDDTDRAFLEKVNGFNMEARYPEEKLAFYRRSTRSFAIKYMSEIERWLKHLESEVP